MKRIILALVLLVSGFGSYAGDSPTVHPTPKELAQQIIIDFQAGRQSQITSNLAAHVLILEKASKESPEDYQVYYALAICYVNQDNIKAGLIAIEKAYTLSQQNVGLGSLYAVFLKMNKQPTKAYEVDKEMVARRPDVPQLQVELAALEMTIQKYDEAIAILEALLQRAPANLTAQDRSVLFYMLGNCYLYTGQQAKAIEALENALSYTPRMATALALLGEVYVKTDKMNKAVTALDKALAINPKYPVALYYKGIYLEKTGSPEMAKKEFQDAYANQKVYLVEDNGEDHYLMFLICEKVSKNEEGHIHKTEARKLLFSYEAPWQQK
jgi:tetratricopeptide (TPR) repeat protein